MVAYAYDARPVVDPTSGSATLVPNATFQFFAYSDDEFTTPLTVRTRIAGTLTNVTSMTSSPEGILDEFEVDDHWRVWAKSGSRYVLIPSIQGLADAAEAARSAAVAAQAAAESAAEDAAAVGALTPEQIDTYLGGVAADLVPTVQGKADLDPVTGKVKAEQMPPTGDGTLDRVTLTGPYTLTPSASWSHDAGHLVILTQDNTGGRVVTFAATVKPADGEALPTVASAPGTETALGFTWSDAANGWIPTLLYVVSPADTTAPIAGTLEASLITTTAFSLTATGASDNRALHAEPYAFSLDNGATWTAYQASATYNATGRTPGTTYTVRHRVRDAAGNVTTGSAITVQTLAAVGEWAYTANGADVTDGATYTFANRAIGSAAANRTVVVVLTYRAASAVTVNSVTVGGVTVTQDVATNQANSCVWIGHATVPSGTTANVVVNLSGTVARAGIGLYRVTGALTVSGATGSGTGTAGVTVPASGFAVAGGIGQTSGGALTMSGFTQDYSVSMGELTYFHTGGHATTPGATTATVATSTTGSNATAAVAYTVA